AHGPAAHHGHARRGQGVPAVSSPAPSEQERMALGRRLRLVASSAAREARPWLRREAWTRENLRAIAAEVRRRPRPVLPAPAALLVIAVAAWALLRSTLPAGIATAVVDEGAFDVTVVESGTLQALRSMTYGSRIQSNQAKIVAMVPEGKMVEKGDLLLLFDAAPFEEEIRKGDAQL